MGKRNTADAISNRGYIPASTPEGRENQMISLAINAAEQQLLNGTASAAIIVHYLKLGTEKARLENEKIRKETKLLEAKQEAIQSSKRSEELYSSALAAMKSYSGDDDDSED